MLTSVRVYRPDNDFVEFSFDNSANDFFVKNISGLGVDRSVVIEDSVSVPGGFYQHSKTNSRNVVMKLGYSNSIVPMATRRRGLMSYFVPGSAVRMEFDTDSLPTVQLFGVVETAEAPVFGQDPDVSISILCSNPYFEALVDTVSPLVVTVSGGIHTLNYEGSVPVGLKWTGSHTADAAINDLHFKPVAATRGVYYRKPTSDTIARVINFSSVLGDRFVKIGSVSYLERLQGLNITVWPILKPGSNQFQINTAGTWTVNDIRWRARYEGL